MLLQKNICLGKMPAVENASLARKRDWTNSRQHKVIGIRYPFRFFAGIRLPKQIYHRLLFLVAQLDNSIGRDFLNHVHGAACRSGGTRCPAQTTRYPLFGMEQPLSFRSSFHVEQRWRYSHALLGRREARP